MANNFDKNFSNISRQITVPKSERVPCLNQTWLNLAEDVAHLTAGVVGVGDDSGPDKGDFGILRYCLLALHELISFKARFRDLILLYIAKFHASSANFAISQFSSD